MTTKSGNVDPTTDSSPGRRVLVAVVTGTPGSLIQDWRERHDPVQARRLPPHATLCYWVNDVDLDALDQQIQHAFSAPVNVRLGGVHEFTNRDGTFFINVSDTELLNEARERLFDGSCVTLRSPHDFTWHVTCVRYPDDARREKLRAAAIDLTQALAIDPIWRIDSIACLELRGDRYHPVCIWSRDRVGMTAS